MSRRLAALAVILLGGAAVAGGGTLGLFTDQQAIGSNAFTAGSITLGVNPTTALVTFSAMMPGDSVTNSLVVSNPGSAQLRYAISSSATNADSKGLKDQLVLTIKTVDVTTPASPCNEFDGTQLYTGDLDSTAGKLVGDSTAGAHGGDRTLNASASETLCWRVSLPSASGNGFEGATTTATFTFDAEQTANNP